MRLAPLTAAVALLSLCPAPPARSQQPASVAAGARVRVSTHHGERLVGELRSVAGDTLVVAVTAPGGQGTLQRAVPATQVRALDVSRTGPRPSRVAPGLITGIAVGGALGYLLTSGLSCSGCDSPGSIGVMLFAPVGGIVGLVIGLTTGRERWTPVAWPPRGTTPP